MNIKNGQHFLLECEVTDFIPGKKISEYDRDEIELEYLLVENFKGKKSLNHQKFKIRKRLFYHEFFQVSLSENKVFSVVKIENVQSNEIIRFSFVDMQGQPISEKAKRLKTEEFEKKFAHFKPIKLKNAS